MDIPALSVAMHQASLAQNVNIALTKKGWTPPSKMPIKP